MVAVLASVLVIVAALSVDLGNAWARGRIVQKQADVSALAAGSLLPMSTNPVKGASAASIAGLAAEYLNANPAAGQEATTADDLTDGDFDDGEIEFLDQAGAACEGVTDPCVRLRLTPPFAHVDFGLAGAVASGTDVSRSATVELFSGLPPMQKVIPLWLPSGCGYGPVDGDTEEGPSPTASSSTTSPSASPSTPTATSGLVVVSPVGSHTISGTSPLAMTAGSTISVSNWSITNAGNNVEKASIRLIAPDNSRFIEYAVTLGNNSSAVPPFQIGTEISDYPGDWRAFAMVQEKGNSKPLNYSINNLVVRVAGTPPPTPSTSTTDAASPPPSDVPVGCAGSDRGNFGQLYSPRVDTTVKSIALGRNLAFGLDHLPIPFDQDAYPIQKECAGQNGDNPDPIPGAQLDDASRDGNNCIKGDTANDGPKLYDGMIGEVDDLPGRLNVAGDSERDTTCSGRSNKTYSHGSDNFSINNDVLSCFLRDGASLDDLAQATGVSQSMLDPAVAESPRFVYLPVVYATDRAQHGYQPIVDYVAAFITDETQASTVSSTDVTTNNGLEVNGGSIKVIRLFVFNKAALPLDAQTPDVDYDPTLGSGNVRLVG